MSEILERVDNMQRDIAESAENAARGVIKAYVDAEYDFEKAFQSATENAEKIAAEFLGIDDTKKWSGKGVLRTEAGNLFGDFRQYAEGFRSAQTIGQSASGMAQSLQERATGYLLAELGPQREELGDAVGALYQEVTGRELPPERRETAQSALGVYRQIKAYQNQGEGLEQIARAA